MHFFKYLSLFILFIFSLNLSAQEYSIETALSGEKGLPEIGIYGFMPDRYNNYWLTSLEGIYRFNGEKATYIHISSTNSQEFKLFTILNDSTFFIAKQELLYLIHYKNDNDYSTKQICKGFFEKGEDIINIFPIDDEVIIVTKVSIMKLDKFGKIVEIIHKDKKHEINTSIKVGNRIIFSNNENRFFLFENGVFESVKNIKFKSDYLFNYGESIYSVDITKKEIIVFKFKNKEIIIDKKIKTPKLNFTFRKIIAVAEDLFYVATTSRGVLIFHNNKSYFWLTKKNGLLSNAIKDIYFINPTVVITAIKGLNYIKSPFIQNFTEKHTLTDNFVWDLDEFQNKLYVGTTSGIIVLKRENDLKYSSSELKEYGERSVYALLNQNDKYLWIVSEENRGIYRFDGKEIINYSSKVPEDLFQIMSNEIDQKGNVWYWGSAIYYMENDKFYKPNIPDSAIHKINSIREFSDSLLVISSVKVAYFYNVYTNNIVKTINYPNIRDAFPIDKNNLMIYDPDDKVVLVTPDSIIKLHDRICGKLGYNFGYLPQYDKYILTTELGVHIWDKKTDSVFHINSLNGLCYEETNQFSIYSSKEGIWIGTTRGVSYIPYKYFNKLKSYPYPITMQLKFHGNKELKNIDEFRVNKNIYEIDYKYNDFKLKLSSNSLLHSVPLSTSFTLKNSKEILEKSVDKFEVNYNNLPPDQYEIEFQAYLLSNINSKVKDKIKFTILPPFYRTAWFISFLILLLFGIIYILIDYRSKKLKRLNKKLNILVKEQTERLETYKSILESVLHTIKDPIAVFDTNKNFILSNGAFNKLEFISITGLLNKLPKKFNKKISRILDNKKIESVITESPIVLSGKKYLLFFNPVKIKKQLRGYSLFLIDITDLLENEEFKIRLNVINQTFATFSHYLNNHLQVITLHLDSYKMENIKFDPERAMSNIQIAVERIKNLLENFETSIKLRKIQATDYAGIENAIFSLKNNMPLDTKFTDD